MIRRETATLHTLKEEGLVRHRKLGDGHIVLLDPETGDYFRYRINANLTGHGLVVSRQAYEFVGRVDARGQPFKGKS